MPAAQSLKIAVENVQPFSAVEAIDLRKPNTGLTESDGARLVAFLDQLITNDVLNASVSEDNGVVRCQLKQLNVVEEYRDDGTELIQALSALHGLVSDKGSDESGITFEIQTEAHQLDVFSARIESAHGDHWVVRARKVQPVPTVLDTLGLANDELRHIRTALSENHGLISIGTPHRRHLEDWHRAICRELSTPDKSVISLAPRLLEHFPRVSQSILPPGEHWDRRLWQLSSQTEADVIVLSDDGTHGYAPEQLGVLSERCLVVQILQTPNIEGLVQRTPSQSNVHRVVMHHPMRRLCSECAVSHNNPSRLEYGFLDRALPTLSDGVNAWLSASQSTHFKKPSGCDSCSSVGYSGELSVVDSLTNLAHEFDADSLASTRTTSLVDMARGGEICLDEARRIITKLPP